MWRVIVRLSIHGDHRSRIRSHLAGLFATMGLQNTQAGTWESPAVTPAVAAAQMGLLLQALADPQGTVAGVAPHAMMHHLWVYIDRVQGT